MTRAVLSCILMAAIAQAPRTAHWQRGAAIAVWIDHADAPSDGRPLVERALRTWTDAAAGRFTLTASRANASWAYAAPWVGKRSDSPAIR